MYTKEQYEYAAQLCNGTLSADFLPAKFFEVGAQEEEEIYGGVGDAVVFVGGELQFVTGSVPRDAGDLGANRKESERHGTETGRVGGGDGKDR